MFYRIENDRVIDFADFKYLDDCIEAKDITADYFRENRDGFKIQEGVVVDYTDSAEYAALQAKRADEALVEQVKIQIDELDKKRIRAICEPSVKNPVTGETWLEYYNQQIQELRSTINS